MQGDIAPTPSTGFAMNAPGPAPARPTGFSPAGFAVPGRLVVFVIFMVQFIVLLLGLGILLPYLRQQGTSIVVLVVGAIAGFALIQVVLGLLMRLIPIRCPTCRGRSQFDGFGWWPFIYRFTCGACGMQRRIEVGGRR